jgi:hypothetical protein
MSQPSLAFPATEIPPMRIRIVHPLSERHPARLMHHLHPRSATNNRFHIRSTSTWRRTIGPTPCIGTPSLAYPMALVTSRLNRVPDILATTSAHTGSMSAPIGVVTNISTPPKLQSEASRVGHRRSSSPPCVDEPRPSCRRRAAISQQHPRSDRHTSARVRRDAITTAFTPIAIGHRSASATPSTGSAPWGPRHQDARGTHTARVAGGVESPSDGIRCRRTCLPPGSRSPWSERYGTAPGCAVPSPRFHSG